MDHSQHRAPRRRALRGSARHALACAIGHVALATGISLGLAAAPMAAWAQGASSQARSYEIPGGALEDALNRFGRESGILLSFSTQTTAGLRTQGLRGHHSVQGGLDTLLAGSGLRAIRQADGSYFLVPTPASAIATVAAQAQTELPTLKVYGVAGEDPNGRLDGYAARRSLTATKTDTALIETPQSISIIGREEMEARSAQDVMEAIRYTPGLSVGAYGPDNRGWDDTLLRGFSTYYSGYADGLARTPAGVTYYQTEPYGLERVEVLRGPSSMAFGQGDAGGIVNRVSKRPDGERIREIQLQYGSFQRQQAAFDLGDRLGDSAALSYRLVGVHLDSNDQDEYPDGRKLNRTRSYLAPSLRWQPSEATSLTVLGEWLRNQSAEDPYYIVANGQLTDRKMGDPSFSGIAQDQRALGYQFEQRLGSYWSLRQNARHSRLKLDRQVVWLDSVDDDRRTVHRIARSWNDPMQQTGIDTSLLGKLRSGSVEHTVLIGVDWNQQKASALRFIGAAPDLDLYAPVYGVAIPQPRDPLADYDQTTRQSGVYVQDQIKFDERWLLTLGGRQDRVRQVTDDRLSASVTRSSDSAFSGRAGLTYLAANGWAPYLSYAESFLTTPGLDSDSRPFDPSRGKQVETGIKYQPAQRKLLLTAAVFDLRKTNVVSFDPITFEGRQIGEQRSRGVELEAKGELRPGWNATASYTWMDSSILRSADPEEIGKRPPAVPMQTAAAWLDYTPGERGLGYGAGLRYIGNLANDEHNTSSVPSVMLVDAVIHYALPSWRLALNASNLFDKNYMSICYHGECYRGNQRSLTLSARYEF